MIDLTATCQTRSAESSSVSSIKINRPVVDLADYPGGVAAWGALPAVFDSHSQEFDRGIHIHARLSERGAKIIDKSFQEIEIIWQNKNIVLNEDTAVSYTMSSIFNIELQSVSCCYCGIELLDRGLAAVIPSFDHYCSFCGELTETAKRCVVNPIMNFKNWLGDSLVKRPATMPSRKIILNHEKFPGGFQIWGSNPSIIWTAERLEESAIHVHAYNLESRRVIDNTYSEVWVGDELLDIEMVRVLQIQKSLPELEHFMTSLECPQCGHLHFDQGLHAVIAHQKHQCELCNHHFITSLAISNPALALLKSLQLSADGVAVHD